MKINLPKSKIPRLAELLFKFEGQDFILYDYQKRILLDESPFRIIMKARQLGISWLIALEGLIDALTMPYQTVLFVSSGEEAAKRVLNYVYSFIHGMPIRPKFLTRSLTE
jgi:phage FluMu gp28-like protein